MESITIKQSFKELGTWGTEDFKEFQEIVKKDKR